jgi:hypothetical protein
VLLPKVTQVNAIQLGVGPAPAETNTQANRTRKWLLRMPPAHAHDKGAEIESVYIPESDRGTLCVSSQVGCTLNCTFCHTGTMPLVRNLTTAEIVGQLLVARDRLGDFPGGVAPGDGLTPSGESVRAVSPATKTSSRRIAPCSGRFATLACFCSRSTIRSSP